MVQEYLNTVGRNDAIISVEQNLGGSRPKELFLDTVEKAEATYCLLYTSPIPRDLSTSSMPSSA